MHQTLAPDRALTRAKSLVKRGDHSGARALLSDVAQRFPRNKRLRKALTALGIPPGAPRSPQAAAEIRVERRKVKTGLRRVGTVEILEGLAAGDLVVVEGALKVRPGQPVSPVHARPEPSGEKASQVRGASRSDG